MFKGEVVNHMKPVLKLFTSESVGPGHPDKICDQISDAILDACLRQDPYSRVACECFATTNLIIIGGEVTTNATISYEEIARNTLRKIGYDHKEYGIDANSCEVQVVIKKQSNDIAQGVDNGGAGDQGIMFGYACDETKTYMPLAVFLAHQLLLRADTLRRNGQFLWARPDMKSQVTIDYSDTQQPKIHTVLLSIQHDDDANDAQFKTFIQKQVIQPVLAQFGPSNQDYRVLINPTGRFVIGGPEGDTGLTGRKIIVDTYGGYARHGGGAFSGKDSTKVDRSATYAARYIAKNIVAAKLAKKCEIQISYAIGVAQPISIAIDTFQTAIVSEEAILQAINQLFDLTPAGITKMLDLRTPIFEQTAVFGHFGRLDVDFAWEKLDQVETLRKYFNLESSVL